MDTAAAKYRIRQNRNGDIGTHLEIIKGQRAGTDATRGGSHHLSDSSGHIAKRVGDANVHTAVGISDNARLVPGIRRQVIGRPFNRPSARIKGANTSHVIARIPGIIGDAEINRGIGGEIGDGKQSIGVDTGGNIGKNARNNIGIKIIREKLGSPEQRIRDRNVSAVINSRLPHIRIGIQVLKIGIDCPRVGIGERGLVPRQAAEPNRAIRVVGIAKNRGDGQVGAPGNPHDIGRRVIGKAVPTEWEGSHLARKQERTGTQKIRGNADIILLRAIGKGSHHGSIFITIDKIFESIAINRGGYVYIGRDDIGGNIGVHHRNQNIGPKGIGGKQVGIKPGIDLVIYSGTPAGGPYAGDGYTGATPTGGHRSILSTARFIGTFHISGRGKLEIPGRNGG